MSDTIYEIPAGFLEAESSEPTSYATARAGGRVVAANAVVHVGEMVSLQVLLDHSKAAATFLDRNVAPVFVPLAARERREWAALVGVGTLWGALTGWSFTSRAAPVAPVAAVLGCLAIVVLAATLFAWSRDVAR